MGAKMNVTENELENYIDVFQATLIETANRFIPTHHRKNLLHLSLLPAAITGYISTQFGVAIEYEPSENTSIQIYRGSARVEDLLVQAPRAIRKTGPVIEIAGHHISFYDCPISGAFPFRLTNQEASVIFSNASFTVGNWKRSVHYAEVFGNRLSNNWSAEEAIKRSKDEILAALVDINNAERKRLSITDYINTFKEKMVLLLGDYDENGIKRLERIKNSLIEKGYEPILVKDIPDNPYQDLRQKVSAVGHIARFVIVDDSSKSGHLAELQLCEQNNWVTVVLRAGDKGSSWMTAGIAKFSNVILEHPYDPDAPKTAVDFGCTWAENKLDELERAFDTLYPWRKIDS